MFEMTRCGGGWRVDIWWWQNLISHRGKALAKLKAWLAGRDLEP
jgi:hypothetical protein